MVTNLNLHLISSTLSSLSLAELHFLKDKIDALIHEYSTEKQRQEISLDDLTKSITVELSESSINQWLDQLLGEYAINHLDDSYRKELAKIILPLFTDIQKEAKEQIEPTKKKQRTLGIWKGQIEVSKDFYQTSSDIISEFGIQ